MQLFYRHVDQAERFESREMDAHNEPTARQFPRPTRTRLPASILFRSAAKRSQGFAVSGIWDGFDRSAIFRLAEDSSQLT